MGNDLYHTCQVESKRILWLVALVLASVLLIQCFELPYRDSMLSLLSSGKSYFKFSDNNGGADHKTIGNKENELSYLRNDSSASMAPKSENTGVSPEMFLPENTTVMNHNAKAKIIDRTIAASPDKASDVAISPSVHTVEAETINGTIGAAPGKSRDASEENIAVADIASSPDKASDVAISPSVRFGEENSTASMSVENARIITANPTSSVSPSNSTSPAVDFSPPTIANSNAERNHPPTTTTTKEMPVSAVASMVSISEMNQMLLRSHVSSFSKNPLWPSPADQELLDARFQIDNAPIIKDYPGLYAPIYRNLSIFVRSYELMEQKLKIYIYQDGKGPVFHQGRLKGIYASEGWFMKLLEASNLFVTSNPGEANLFFLPFSSQMLVDYVYVRDSHSFREINKYLANYLDTIKAKYSFWNRTDGTDHFLVACHDWAPYETKGLLANCIRAICNADPKEGFQIGKDVSLPETFVHSAQNPLAAIGGMPPLERKILAFFAGKMHGYVRPILLKHWENKDPDMKMFARLKSESYLWHMKNSKYCICAKGYEVNSPRVVEAIVNECVPVIISDNFVPPFFDVLNWDSFAVFVPEKDIPNLKKILVSISERRYVVMQQRVKTVRQHFLWHNTPVKYDIFHMILHSVWYNRVLRLSPQ